MVRIVRPAAEETVSDETTAWLEEMNPRLAHLQDFQLPDTFRFDYSSTSLPVLEAIILERFGDADSVRAARTGPGPGDRFIEGVEAYLGEALLRVAGGSWSRDHGQAVLNFDQQLDAPPLSPMDLVIRETRTPNRDRVRRRTGRSRTRGDATPLDLPGLGASKRYTPGVDRTEPPPSDYLDNWLARHAQSFPGWAGAHAMAGPWDFSPESLDALEGLLRTTLPPTGEFVSPQEKALADQATWYVGEVMIRTKGGRWFYNPGDPDPYNPVVGRPHVRQDTPVSSLAVPILAIRGMLRTPEPGVLRARLDRYGR